MIFLEDKHLHHEFSDSDVSGLISDAEFPHHSKKVELTEKNSAAYKKVLKSTFQHPYLSLSAIPARTSPAQ